MHDQDLTPGAAAPVAAEQSPNWAADILALRRDRDQGRICGFCSAIAQQTGVDPILIRLAFVIAVMGSGLGIFCYLFAWALTRDNRGNPAPLDRVLPSWRKLNAKVVLSIATVLIALIVIKLSSIFPLGWTPLLIMLFAIWTGQRLSYSPDFAKLNEAKQANQPTVKKALWPSLLTLLVAVGAGYIAWENSSSNLVFALAISLGAIAIGLLASASRGRPGLLIVCGLVLSMALFVTAGSDGRPGLFLKVDKDLLPAPAKRIWTTSDLIRHSHFDTDRSYLDLTNLQLTANYTWNIDASYADLYIWLPIGYNTVVISNFDVTSDLYWHSISKNTTQVLTSDKAFWVDKDAPTLTIVVSSTHASVEVYAK